ncbi:hypothetical protein [Serratia proteamaculans]
MSLFPRPLPEYVAMIIFFVWVSDCISKSSSKNINIYEGNATRNQRGAACQPVSI